MKFHKGLDGSVYAVAEPIAVELVQDLPYVEAARAYEQKLAAQVMWGALGILGFDQDGDKHPGAMIAGMGYARFCQMFLEFIADHREYDDEVMADLSA